MNAMPSPRDEAWVNEQVQAAIAVLQAEWARQYEECRQERETRARQKMADCLALADQCEVRARMYDAWAAEYPAAHRKHHQYCEEADRQRRLKAKAMQEFRIEREWL